MSNETGVSSLVTYSITLCIYNGISTCKYLTRKIYRTYFCTAILSYNKFN